MMKWTGFALALALLLGSTAGAQINFNPNTVYTQDFDSLGGPPPGTVAWANNVTLLGWFAADGGGVVAVYHRSNGSSATGGLYSYGPNPNGVLDRALGSQASNATGEITWGVQFVNAHPTWVLTSFTVSYDVEQWRDASEDDTTTYFEYSLNAVSVDDPLATWNPAPFADLNSIHSNNSGALDGNAAANRYNVVLPVTGINWAPGTSLWLRWRDPNDPGSDHGMAIDNFSFSAVPEPTTFALVGLGMGAAGLVSRRLRRKKTEQPIAV
jgi:hypothetical protein